MLRNFNMKSVESFFSVNIAMTYEITLKRTPFTEIKHL